MGDSNSGIRQIEKFLMHQCQRPDHLDGPELTTAVFGAVFWWNLKPSLFSVYLVFYWEIIYLWKYLSRISLSPKERTPSVGNSRCFRKDVRPLAEQGQAHCCSPVFLMLPRGREALHARWVRCFSFPLLSAQGFWTGFPSRYWQAQALCCVSIVKPFSGPLNLHQHQLHCKWLHLTDLGDNSKPHPYSVLPRITWELLLN